MEEKFLFVAEATGRALPRQYKHFITASNEGAAHLVARKLFEYKFSFTVREPKRYEEALAAAGLVQIHEAE
jgi:hypothetical protein